MLLTLHDALEISIRALLDHDRITLPDGPSKKPLDPNLSFEKLCSLVIDRVYPESGESAPKKAIVARCNNARVAFKHYGTPPDLETARTSFIETRKLLVDLTEAICGAKFEEIATTMLIRNEEVRKFLDEAKRLNADGDCKSALEQIAIGLSLALETVKPLIHVGYPVSEDALFLASRGVDPASFLAMQQYLPRIHSGNISPDEWSDRHLWHEGNWNRESSEFCLKVAVSVIIHLQGTTDLPTPIRFHDIFEDVVTITSASAICRRITSSGTVDEQWTRGQEATGFVRQEYKAFDGIPPTLKMTGSFWWYVVTPRKPGGLAEALMGKKRTVDSTFRWCHRKAEERRRGPLYSDTPV